MAITITYDREGTQVTFDKATGEYGERRVEKGQVDTRYIGLVTRVERWEARVSSDHAWIDTGNRLTVWYWDPETQTLKNELFYPSDQNVEATEDAPKEVRDLAFTYEMAVAWVNEAVKKLQDFRREQAVVVEGDRVEVYKGRKAPKGVYEVARVGMSDYGRYYHLRDEKGTWHRYINVDNCRKVKNVEAEARFVRENFNTDYFPFINKLTTDPLVYPRYRFDASTVGALADLMTEKGDPLGPPLSAWANVDCVVATRSGN